MQRERNKTTIPATPPEAVAVQATLTTGPGAAGAVHPTLHKTKSKTPSTCTLTGSSDTTLSFLWGYSKLSARLCSWQNGEQHEMASTVHVNG